MRRRIVKWDRTAGREESTLFVNEPAPHGAGTVNYKDYDTFISHKGEDITIAERLGDEIYQCGLAPYLDRWDPQVDGDSPALEEYLRDVIRETPSILAVVTENTPTSWWVPFEIGVARETDSVVATFLWVDPRNGRRIRLPSYLQTWPILASTEELGNWAGKLATSKSRHYIQKSVLLEMEANQPRYTTIDQLVSRGIVEFFD